MKKTRKESDKIWRLSKDIFPGGVNSPVRSFRSVGTDPIAMKSGSGAYLTDEDGNEYLDFVNSWGPLILGHVHPRVRKAVRRQARKGMTFGTITKREMELGRIILKNLPHLQKVRFMNSGTEAVMTAIRLARGFTHRNKILKFEGSYHGHLDSLLVQAGSGLLTMTDDITTASSPGIPNAAVSDTIVVPLDDDKAIRDAFSRYGNEIAAAIIEPLPANAGLLPQRYEFLKELRSLTYESGALLIFDEVISGFRLGISGFAGKYFMEPDLVTYGKIIGGGLPVGAVGGKAEIMDYLAPSGRVYQAGTLSGNPLAMAAGIATLKCLTDGSVYQHLDNLADYLRSLFRREISPLFTSDNFGSKPPFHIVLVQEASLFWLSIREGLPPDGDFYVVRRTDQIWSGASAVYSAIHAKMLDRSVYMAPSAYEVGFLSAPMTMKDISFFIRNLRETVMSVIKNSG